MKHGYRSLTSLLIITFICFLYIPMTLADFTSVELAKNAIIRVYVEHYVGSKLHGYATGSGFVVESTDNGTYYIITNQHVIASAALEDSSGGSIQTEVIPYIIYDNVENCVPAKIVAIHNVLDMAILSIDKSDLERSPIQIRSFEANEIIGETVYSIGFPAASDNIMSEISQSMLYSDKDHMTWAEGKAIRILESEQTDSSAGQVIQTNATINGGNSGGPLIDEFGNVVGICSFGATQGDNTYYAITSNELIKFLDENQINYSKLSNPSRNIIISLLTVVSIAILIILYLFVKLNKKKKEPVSDLVSPPAAAFVPVCSDPLSISPRNGTGASPMREMVCTSGILIGARFRISGDLLMGRDPKRCQVVFPMDTKGISAVHCKISFDGKQVKVTDQESTCGTYINGKKLPPCMPIQIHRGQTLALGSENNLFLLGGNSGRE